jgi:4-amino-4-deoxy-L-arabinose transferase-like glycosyltransferase
MAEPTAPAADALEPMPWRIVGGVCGAVVLLLLLVARRYGWHRDELYFLEAGVHHLAWGYADQPPFTPFVARIANDIAPGNLVVLRTAPALSAAATILFGTLVARELGGRRTALVAAMFVMVGGFALGVGHLLVTASFDLMAWMALLWLTARLLRTDNPRWWIAFGGVAGLSMLNKNLLVMLVVALAIGLVVERRWALLLSPWLVAGAALAFLIASPNLWWEAHHGWPQIEMARALSRRIGADNRTQLIPQQLLFAGPALLPVLWWGIQWLRRSAEGARYRPLL